jgi:ribonucleoside-diphosphate reductase alpha chain
VRKTNLANVVVMPKGTPTAATSPAHALQMRAADSVGSLALASEVVEAKVTLNEPVAVTVMDRRTEARLKGYEGECCSECGNYTMVRNGTCLKCDTCGGTSGCS